MDGLGIAAVIVAAGGLLGVLTTSYLQIKASNRVTAAAQTTTTAVEDLKPVLEKTAEKVEQVHVLTKSNYVEQKELNAALRAQLEELIKQRDEAQLMALEATRRQLEIAQAEVNRLNAASSPSERGLA